jgi:Spy/CpxP family protein refolding chaperone
MVNLTATLLLSTLLGAAQGGCQTMQGQAMMHQGMMDDGWMGTGMHYFRMLHDPQMIETLNLTEDQQKKLKDLRYSQQEKALDIRQKLEKEQLALSKLMDDENPNRAQIEAKIKTIGSLRTDLELLHAGMMFDIQKILTADQWKQIKDMRGGHGMGMGSPQGNPGMLEDDMDMPGMHN